MIVSACACLRVRSYRWEFEKDGEQLLVDVSGRLTLDDSRLIREAALAGYGLAHVSKWEVADDLQDGRLVQLLTEWIPSFPGVCLYFPGHRHVPAGLRAFIDLVQEQRRHSG
jgi:DNA-binding transcriptional LysR family regulator